MPKKIKILIVVAFLVQFLISTWAWYTVVGLIGYKLSGRAALAGDDTVHVPAVITNKVTYDSDNGSELTTMVIRPGDTVTILADPTKDGYTFAGWQLDGKAFDFNTVIDKDINLKAAWTKVEKTFPTAIVSNADITSVDRTKYLSITEWGIKGLYNGVHPISYSISQYNGWLKFSPTDLPSWCSSGVGMMKRLAADDPVSEASTPPGNDDSTKASIALAQDSFTILGGHKKVGEYYYVLTTAWQNCGPIGSETQNLEKTIFSDLNEFFQSLQVE